MPASVADADYLDVNMMTPLDAIPGVDVGIAINDSLVDMTTSPNWGPYTPSHVYEIQFAATGARIAVAYHDGLYANNSGSLTLEILEEQ